MIRVYAHSEKTRTFATLDEAVAYASGRGKRLFWLNWSAYSLID